MSKLMKRRFDFREMEEKFFKPLIEVNEPLAVNAEFKRCESSLVYNEKEEKMNVLILGLDSVSSSQFRRIFPRTFKHLNATGTIFDSLNSVGSNTYPNMLGNFFLK